ncbi:LysM peptidoglycan-binding domain-containing protein [uncultured Actinomyces sp.]|uniref:LysM peptidoglycan-binding domain-containing protein n=1 Tax=uncultured Actinomyces sp. TaxID=249061 RepID=UPI002617EAF1|nr:LysM peptidoglycan-binding domain-containing protein [uncultured Actinomyces sp.]
MRLNRNSNGSAGIALAGGAAFAVTAFAALSIAIDNASTMRLLHTDANALLYSSLSPNTLALPLFTAVAGFTVAALSLWSLASLLLAETLLALAKRGTPVNRLLELVVNTSSPLVRSLLKKRVATLALSASLIVTTTAAFAPAPATIQDNLGWQAVSTQEPAPSETTVPSDLTLSAPSTPASPAPQSTTPQPETPADTNQTMQLTSPPEPVPKDASTASTTGVSTQADSLEDAPVEQPDPGNPTNIQYVVRAGDSLWSIASIHLQTSEPTKIAVGWQRIYNLNKSVIGGNPDLIYPGMTLTLPGEDL